MTQDREQTAERTDDPAATAPVSPEPDAAARGEALPGGSGTQSPAEANPGVASLRQGFLRSMTTSYARFQGRAGRREFWGFFLFIALCFALAVFLDSLIRSGAEVGGGLFFALVFLGSLIPAIAVSVRRLHDLGVTGWLYLLTILPGVNVLFLIAFAFPGQQHANRYGAPVTPPEPAP